MYVNGVVIVAAGKGKRMNMSTPKQFMSVSGKPVIVHTIEKFLAFDKNIEMVVVLNKEHLTIWDEMKTTFFPEVSIIAATGGEERYHSVKSGLAAIKRSDLVAIHDAVRPCVSLEIIQKSFTSAATYGAGIPVTALKDSIRHIHGDDSTVVDRNQYKIVQTPQTFKYELIIKAYSGEIPESTTDDASVYQACYGSVQLVDGDSKNIKITTQEDLQFTEILLKK